MTSLISPLDGSPSADPVDVDVEQADIDGLKIYLHAARYSPQMLNTLRKGAYEGGERFLVKHILAPSDRVLEIGGAVGLIAMVAAKIVGPANVVSFEANPSLVIDAGMNYRANDLPIRVENAVLVNEWRLPQVGPTVEFHVARHFWASSLVRSAQTVETVHVPVRSLEQEIEASGSNVLVCDIEGGEIDLLEAADLAAIEKIILEIHPKMLGYKPTNRLIRSLVCRGFNLDYESTRGQVVAFYKGDSPAWLS